MTQEVVDRLLHRIQNIISTTEPPVLLFSGAIQDPTGNLKKHSIFEPASKTAKIRKTTPKALEKHRKSTLGSPKNGFSENIVFAIPSLRKRCFQSSNRQEFHLKSMHKVTWMETSPTKTQNLTNMNPKNFQNGLLKSPRNH